MKIILPLLLLCLAVNTAHGQNELSFSKIRMMLEQPPADSQLLPAATAITMSSNMGNVTVSRVNSDPGNWKVEGAQLDGTVFTVKKGELTDWYYISGTDTVRISSNCKNKDWHKYFSWTVSDGKEKAVVVSKEPDCPGSFYWLVKADSLGCKPQWGIQEKNTYITFSKVGKGKECLSEGWKVTEDRKLPVTCSSKLRFAVSFIAVVSLTLGETERKRSQ